MSEQLSQTFIPIVQALCVKWRWESTSFSVMSCEGKLVFARWVSEWVVWLKWSQNRSFSFLFLFLFFWLTFLHFKSVWMVSVQNWSIMTYSLCQNTKLNIVPWYISAFPKHMANYREVKMLGKHARIYPGSLPLCKPLCHIKLTLLLKMWQMKD